MKTVPMLLVLAALAGLSGCETIAMTSPGVAKHAGIDQSITGRSYKTFATTLPTLRLATLKTFRRMGIQVSSDKEGEEGWVLSGTAQGRDVEVTLERVSRRTTRMKVMVERGIPLIGDGATGTEIILQTTETVDGLAVRG